MVMEEPRTRRVSWGETDAAGIVFYPNYFRLFDQGTHDLFRELGHPVTTMLDRGYVIPVVESKARFLTSLRYDDHFTTASRIAEIRTRAFRIEHRLIRGDEVVCEGYEVRIWARLVDGGKRLEPEALPHDLRLIMDSAQA
jgi:4-hydroxybenzoyl-CoA thioesterase